MLIKHQALIPTLERGLAQLYVLFGQEQFLLNQAVKDIQIAWQKAHPDREELIINLSHPADLVLLDSQTNNFSLFSSSLLLDIRYDKKSMDAPVKEWLTNYLKNSNPNCVLILRAPNLFSKHLQWLESYKSVQTVQIVSLNENAMTHWIKEQLQQKKIQFEPQIPALIYQYTQANMSACAQVIEKIELSLDDNQICTIAFVQDQLTDLSDYQLFELAEACLTHQSDKLILLLDHARQNKTEPTLVLWILAQELRTLIQLIDLTKTQGLPFNTACNQLKIWSNRIKLYQIAIKTARLHQLNELVRICQKLDERIKSFQLEQIWNLIEQVALSFCLGKKVGYFA